MDWPKLAGQTRWPKMDWPKSALTDSGTNPGLPDSLVNSRHRYMCPSCLQTRHSEMSFRTHGSFHEDAIDECPKIKWSARCICSQHSRTAKMRWASKANFSTRVFRFTSCMTDSATPLVANSLAPLSRRQVAAQSSSFYIVDNKNEKFVLCNFIVCIVVRAIKFQVTVTSRNKRVLVLSTKFPFLLSSSDPTCSHPCITPGSSLSMSRRNMILDVLLVRSTSARNHVGLPNLDCFIVDACVHDRVFKKAFIPFCFAASSLAFAQEGSCDLYRRPPSGLHRQRVSKALWLLSHMHQTQLLLIASCLHVLLVLDVSTEGAIIPHTHALPQVL